MYLDAARPSAILRVHDFRCWRLGDMPAYPENVRSPADTVAKVFLRDGTQGLRAAGAAIEK
jgi:hypothetical protein